MGDIRGLGLDVSQHFTWDEVETTIHRNINNTLPEILEQNALITAQRMEKVRELLNRRTSCFIHINSWYRCLELNAAIGSNNATSFHPKATAVDFVAPRFGRPQDIIAYLMQFANELQFDQLIYEKTWIHIGWDPTGVYRSQVLTLNSDGSYSKGLVA